MKRLLTILCFSLVFLFSACGEETGELPPAIEVDGYKLQLSLDGEYYTVDSIIKDTTPFESMPTEHDGIPVTEIGESVFAERLDLEEVVIPENITSICANAFAGCTSITKVTFPEELNFLEIWHLRDAPLSKQSICPTSF